MLLLTLVRTASCCLIFYYNSAAFRASMVSSLIPVLIVFPAHCIFLFPLCLFTGSFFAFLLALHCLATSLLLCFSTVPKQCHGCQRGAVWQAPAHASHSDGSLDGGRGNCWTQASKTASNPMASWPWQRKRLRSLLTTVTTPHTDISALGNKTKSN